MAARDVSPGTFDRSSPANHLRTSALISTFNELQAQWATIQQSDRPLSRLKGRPGQTTPPPNHEVDSSKGQISDIPSATCSPAPAAAPTRSTHSTHKPCTGKAKRDETPSKLRGLAGASSSEITGTPHDQHTARRTHLPKPSPTGHTPGSNTKATRRKWTPPLWDGSTDSSNQAAGASQSTPPPAASVPAAPTAPASGSKTRQQDALEPQGSSPACSSLPQLSCTGKAALPDAAQSLNTASKSARSRIPSPGPSHRHTISSKNSVGVEGQQGAGHTTSRIPAVRAEASDAHSVPSMDSSLGLSLNDSSLSNFTPLASTDVGLGSSLQAADVHTAGTSKHNRGTRGAPQRRRMDAAPAGKITTGKSVGDSPMQVIDPPNRQRSSHPGTDAGPSVQMQMHQAALHMPTPPHSRSPSHGGASSGAAIRRRSSAGSQQVSPARSISPAPMKRLPPEPPQHAALQVLAEPILPPQLPRPPSRSHSHKGSAHGKSEPGTKCSTSKAGTDQDQGSSVGGGSNGGSSHEEATAAGVPTPNISKQPAGKRLDPLMARKLSALKRAMVLGSEQAVQPGSAQPPIPEEACKHSSTDSTQPRPKHVQSAGAPKPPGGARRASLNQSLGASGATSTSLGISTSLETDDLSLTAYTRRASGSSADDPTTPSAARPQRAHAGRKIRAHSDGASTPTPQPQPPPRPLSPTTVKATMLAQGASPAQAALAALAATRPGSRGRIASPDILHRQGTPPGGSKSASRQPSPLRGATAAGSAGGAGHSECNVVMPAVLGGGDSRPGTSAGQLPSPTARLVAEDSQGQQVLTGEMLLVRQSAGTGLEHDTITSMASAMDSLGPHLAAAAHLAASHSYDDDPLPAAHGAQQPAPRGNKVQSARNTALAALARQRNSVAVNAMSAMLEGSEMGSAASDSRPAAAVQTQTVARAEGAAQGFEAPAVAVRQPVRQRPKWQLPEDSQQDLHAEHTEVQPLNKWPNQGSLQAPARPGPADEASMWHASYDQQHWHHPALPQQQPHYGPYPPPHAYSMHQAVPQGQYNASHHQASAHMGHPDMHPWPGPSIAPADAPHHHPTQLPHPGPYAPSPLPPPPQHAGYPMHPSYQPVNDMMMTRGPSTLSGYLQQGGVRPNQGYGTPGMQQPPGFMPAAGWNANLMHPSTHAMGLPPSYANGQLPAVPYQPGLHDPGYGPTAIGHGWPPDKPGNRPPLPADVPDYMRQSMSKLTTGWAAGTHAVALGRLSSFADLRRGRPAAAAAPPPSAMLPSQGPMPPPPAPVHRNTWEMHQDRRQAVQAAFEGMSLAEVLASAPKKELPLPRKQGTGSKGNAPTAPDSSSS